LRVHVLPRITPKPASLAVEKFLILLPTLGSIVLPATRIATLATVVLPAAKGTAEIPPASVAGMSEETDSAVAATHCAILQVRAIP
jgi:hypothetical protein